MCIRILARTQIVTRSTDEFRQLPLFKGGKGDFSKVSFKITHLCAAFRIVI